MRNVILLHATDVMTEWIHAHVFTSFTYVCGKEEESIKADSEPFKSSFPRAVMERCFFPHYLFSFPVCINTRFFFSPGSRLRSPRTTSAPVFCLPQKTDRLDLKTFKINQATLIVCLLYDTQLQQDWVQKKEDRIIMKWSTMNTFIPEGDYRTTFSLQRNFWSFGKREKNCSQRSQVRRKWQVHLLDIPSMQWKVTQGEGIWNPRKPNGIGVESGRRHKYIYSCLPFVGRVLPTNDAATCFSSPFLLPLTMTLEKSRILTTIEWGEIIPG